MCVYCIFYQQILIFPNLEGAENKKNYPPRGKNFPETPQNRQNTNQKRQFFPKNPYLKTLIPGAFVRIYTDDLWDERTDVRTNPL